MEHHNKPHHVLFVTDLPNWRDSLEENKDTLEDLLRGGVAHHPVVDIADSIIEGQHFLSRYASLPVVAIVNSKTSRIFGIAQSIGLIRGSTYSFVVASENSRLLREAKEAGHHAYGLRNGNLASASLLDLAHYLNDSYGNRRIAQASHSSTLRRPA